MSFEDDQAKLLRCIGQPTRLRIIKLLSHDEKCVCEISGTLAREQSSVSHHLKALKECDIVVTRQEAKNIYYRLADPGLARLVIGSESLLKGLSLCRGEG
jgi:ArsR family transcriptional regulator